MHLPFTWHLGGDAEGVRELSLSGPELPEGLGNGHRVDPAAQHLVQLLTSGRQTENVPTIHRGLKTVSDESSILREFY